MTKSNLDIIEDVLNSCHLVSILGKLSKTDIERNARIDNALAALKEIREREAWQPIETCPESVPVVLSYPDNFYAVNTGKLEFPSYKETKKLAKDGIWPNYKSYMPTGWKYIEPPRSLENGGEE